MEKGISPVMATFIAIVILIVVFMIFFTFQRGAFFQQEALFAETTQQASQQIPCTKAPVVSIPPVTFINPNGSYAANLSATLSSSCFEPLDVAWSFTELNNATTLIENECPYNFQQNQYGIVDNSSGRPVFSTYNCSEQNHTYLATTPADVWKLLPIKVSAFGLVSGFYTEKESMGFVKDPSFRLIKMSEPDVSDFSCVTFGISTAYYGGYQSDPRYIGVSIDVTDKSKHRDLESINPIGMNTANITYRAPYFSGEHKVEVTGTKIYQTTAPLEMNYTIASGVPIFGSPEVAVMSQNNVGELDIYGTKPGFVGKRAPIDSKLFPSGNQNQQDFSAGDLDNDRVNEFAFLMTSGSSGDLFVQSYIDLKRSLGPELDALSIDDLRRMWPDVQLPDLGSGNGWQAVAASSDEIKTKDGGVGNIVALGNPGDLALYKYAPVLHTITEVARGDNLPDKVGANGQWRDVYVFDSDAGKQWIYALYEGTTQSGTLVFQYKDIDKATINDTQNADTTSFGDGGRFDLLPTWLGEYGNPFDIDWRKIVVAHDHGKPGQRTASSTIQLGKYKNNTENKDYYIVRIEGGMNIFDTKPIDANNVEHSFEIIDFAVLPPKMLMSGSMEWVNGVYQWVTYPLYTDDQIAMLYIYDNQYKIAIFPSAAVIGGFTPLDPLNSGAENVISLADSSFHWSSMAAGDVACI